MNFQFIHTADLHLDCPFSGIGDSNIALKLIESTFNAFDRIIDLAIEKQVAFLLIAGDIYDAKDKSLKAQLRFQKGMRRLEAENIGVYVVSGNHDPANGWTAGLDMPSNVHLFGHGKPKSLSVFKGGVHIASICGWSYPKEDVQDDMASLFVPDPKSSYNIALLHCNCGSSTEYENYAPCTPTELLTAGFNYWALGHIHKRSVISDKNPWIIYPGNPQGINPKETGSKGCYLVDVGDDGSTKLEFLETDYVRWHAEDIPMSNITRIEEFMRLIHSRIDSLRLENDKSTVVRFTLVDHTPLHSELTREGSLQGIIEDLRSEERGERNIVWVEAIIDKTKPVIDLEDRRKANDITGDFLRLVDEYRNSSSKREDMMKDLDVLFSDRRGRRWIDRPDDANLLEWLEQVETVGLDYLI